MATSHNIKKNILVIDPDREFCKSVCLYLEESYNLIRRQRLEYVHYTIRLKRIDLLLIDADFFQDRLSSFLNSIHKKHPDLKIVVMYTFFAGDKKEELEIADEADALIAKPFDVRKLEEHIEQLLIPQTHKIHS